MAYMLAGVTFIVIAGLDLGYSVLWLNDTGILLNYYYKLAVPSGFTCILYSKILVWFKLNTIFTTNAL